MRVTTIILAATAALSACDAPTPPRNAAMSAASMDIGQGDAQHTIKTDGEGNAQLPVGFGISDFAFETKMNAAGKIQGAFRMYRERNGLTSDFTGELTCLSVDPENSRAWVGGVVTTNNSTDPNQQLPIHQPGQDVWFRVVDNGNGGEVADRITVLGFKGAILTSEQYCHDKPWLAGEANTFPLVQGDIRVKPKQ